MRLVSKITSFSTTLAGPVSSSHTCSVKTWSACYAHLTDWGNQDTKSKQSDQQQTNHCDACTGILELKNNFPQPFRQGKHQEQKRAFSPWHCQEVESHTTCYQKFFKYIPFDNTCVHVFAFCMSSNPYPTFVVQVIVCKISQQVQRI